MTMSQTPVFDGSSAAARPGVPVVRPRGYMMWRRFSRSRVALLGLAIVATLVATAAFAPRLAPADPLALVAQPFVPPGGGHLMGTDNLGRDVLSGVIYGSRVSLLVGALATAASFVIGVLVGALAGYSGGGVDAGLMRTAELFQVMPRFVLGLVLVALAGPGIGKIIFVIGILSWPPVARVVRAEVLSLREREFVAAARAVGCSPSAIIFRQILPNALTPIIVLASLEVAHAILLESGLSFIGLGDPNLVSWGTMLNNAQSFMRDAWWTAVFPGAAIFITVLGLNFLGDGLNLALEPRFTTVGGGFAGGR
jgi:peptide/nickel transport system permease protein